jgi:hypothetical protein
MTYGDIRFRLAQLLPGVSHDLIDGWIGERYTEILDRLKWQRRDASAAIATVIGTDIYKLPADCRALKSIRGPLGPMEYFDATKHVIGTVPGTPQTWRPVWDSATDPPQQQVQVFPVPDAVVTLTAEYTAEEATFGTGTTSNSLLPWMRPGCLIAGVEADGQNHKGNFAAGDRKEVRFEKLLNDMVRTECARIPAKTIQLAAKYRNSGYHPPFCRLP